MPKNTAAPYWSNRPNAALAVIGYLLLLFGLQTDLLAMALPVQAETGIESQPHISPEQFLGTMENALAGQRVELEELRSRLGQLDQLSTTLLVRVRGYESEMSAYQQLLLMSRIPLEEIERAVRNNRITHRKLNQQMEMLQARYDEASLLFVKAGDQIKLLDDQMSSLLRSNVSLEQEQKLETVANELNHVLNEKKNSDSAISSRINM